MTLKFKSKPGYVTIQLIAFILLSLMFSGIAIDVAYYFAAQNELQSAANAGALAGAKELFTGTATTPATRQSSAATQAVNLAMTYSNSANNISVSSANDVEFGYIDPTTQVYDAANFTTASTDPNYAKTGGYNAVRVSVNKTAGSTAGQLPTIMAQLIGINAISTAARAVGMVDGNVSQVNGGLRPFFGCQAAFDAANVSGAPETHTVQIYGSNITVDGAAVAGCPPPPSGNWGFSDLSNSNGAVGTSTMANWILNGYTGTINTGSTYSFDSSPGNNISASSIKTALNTLIANQTVVMVPLIDSITGTGSTARGHIAGYAGFVFTGLVKKGSVVNVTGYFTKTLCTDQCVSGGNTFGSGTVKIRLAG